MSIEIGTYDGMIISHTIQSTNSGATFVALRCSVNDGVDQTVVKIWLTEKAMGMARRALKVCGFDPDRQKLEELNDNTELLAGNRVPIIIEEAQDPKYGLQASVFLGEISKKKLANLTQALRAVKKDNDPVVPPTGDDIPF